MGFGKNTPNSGLIAVPARRIQPQTPARIFVARANAASRHGVLCDGPVAGGKDDGPPGDREAAMTTYFAAFI